MRASRRLPSFWVPSVCHTFDPAWLISIAPSASPETLSVTCAATSVGSPADGDSNASCGGSGSKRSVTGTDAAAGSALPAALRRHTETVHSPGPGACTASREIASPTCSPWLQLPAPAEHSLYAAAAIGARSLSIGFVHVRAKLLLLRHWSPPSTDVSTRAGAELSIRAVTGAESPMFPAVSCARTTSACVPSVRLVVSTLMLPGPLGQGTPAANAPSGVATTQGRRSPPPDCAPATAVACRMPTLSSAA